MPKLVAYSQTRDANWRVAYVGGWCLKYVQDAFGTDHPYASAMDAWDANYSGGNHPGENPPAGVTVPIYFALGNVPAGHVAISLDDGSIASSTQLGTHAQGFIHPNIQNVIDTYAKYNGGCTYLGWSEYVGTVQVVSPDQATSQPSQGGDMPVKTTLDTARIVAHGILARNGIAGRSDALDGSSDTDLTAGHVNVDLTNEYIQGLFLSDEGRQWRDSQDANSINGINQRLVSSDLVPDLNAKLSVANATIKSLQEQVDKPPVENPTGKVAPKPTSIPPTPSNQTSTRAQTFTDWLVSLFKGSK